MEYGCHKTSVKLIEKNWSITMRYNWLIERFGVG